MLYDLALVLTTAIYGWIALDLLFSRAWRRRFVSVSCAAAALAAWAAGELLLRRAASPDEVLFARRVLFLGVCALGPCWLWAAGQATRAEWFERRPWLVGLAALPAVGAYATFYGPRTGWFVDWTAVPVERGPLFAVHAAYSWALIITGLALFYRFLAPISPARVLAALATAGWACLIVNAAYLALGSPGEDPTPIALGAAALFLRLAVVETGLAPYYLPFARREVTEALQIGLLVADARGRVVDANLAAGAISGVDDPVGLPLDQVLAAASRQPIEVEVELSPLARDGTRYGTIAVLEDRTEVRAAERRIELATRFEALGFLVSGVAHEINNPLSYVRSNLGFLETLSHDLIETGLYRELPPRSRRIAQNATAVLGDAIEGAERIARLVHRLGSFARVDTEPGPAAFVDVAMVTRRAVDMASLGQRSDLFVLDESDDLPGVLGREDEIVQMLLHLLINAIQAGGKTPPITVRLRRRAEGVTIEVIDRGPGIPPDQLPHVFDPFFTTKGEGGTGLGLSVSYDFARQNGGFIEVANRPEGGAVFTVWLPALEEPEEDADSAAG